MQGCRWALAHSVLGLWPVQEGKIIQVCGEIASKLRWLPVEGSPDKPYETLSFTHTPPLIHKPLSTHTHSPSHTLHQDLPVCPKSGSRREQTTFGIVCAWACVLHRRPGSGEAPTAGLGAHWLLYRALPLPPTCLNPSSL